MTNVFFLSMYIFGWSLHAKSKKIKMSYMQLSKDCCSRFPYVITFENCMCWEMTKKSHLYQSYDKQNLTLVVISYEIMNLAEGSFNKFHMK